MDQTLKMLRTAKVCLTRNATRLAAAVAVGYFLVEVVRFMSGP